MTELIELINLIRWFLIFTAINTFLIFLLAIVKENREP